MITINIYPIIFSIGHIHIRWYSLIVLTAIIVGVILTKKEAERKGFKKDDILDAAMWVIMGGIIGARLFHVIDHWPDEYAANPIRAIYIWDGGLAIWGALAGGLLVLGLIAWRRSWNLPRLLDTVAPGVVLGQAIGRFACIITGDAMGKPTTGPFGIAYANPGAMVPKPGVYYTPMPVFEIIANFGIFILLWKLRKRNWPDGQLFLLYLVLYGIERFFLAFTSSYLIVAFGMTQSQIVALICLAIAIPLLIRLQMKQRQIAIQG